MKKVAFIGTGGTIASIGKGPLDYVNYGANGVMLQAGGILDRFPEVQQVWHGEADRVAALLLVFRLNNHKRVEVFVLEVRHEQLPHQAEHGRIRADSKRQRDHRNCGRGRTLQQHPKAITKVLRKCHRGPPE